MLKLLLAVAICSCAFSTVDAQQNLVPNGSFEERWKCPPAENYFNGYVKDWFRPSNSTPNFFHEGCTDSALGFSSSAPKNFAGYQKARSGSGYAGIGCYSVVHDDAREYVAVRLLDSLRKDSTYCVKFFVSLGTTWGMMAANNLGLHISMDSVLDDNWFPLPVTPQILQNPNTPITDTLWWTRIEGTYVATGGERFITIGNFQYDDQTATTGSATGQNGAYYFIDDVGVYLDACPLSADTNVLDTSSTNPISSLPFAVYPSPNETYFDVQFGLVENESAVIEVFDVVGRLVESVNTTSQITRVSTKSFANGVYIVSLRVNDKQIGAAKWIKSD